MIRRSILVAAAAALAVTPLALAPVRAQSGGDPAGGIRPGGDPGGGDVRPEGDPDGPYLVVLGIAQDGGVPQAGDAGHPGWTDPDRRRRVVSLGVVDPATGERWLFEATPDFPEQLARLDAIHPVDRPAPGLAGIFLTHAHVGHYAGLIHVGHEGIGADGVPVYAMPRMAAYLRENGPWSQLVEYGNVEIRPLADGVPARLNARLSVTPLRVPHREEYSEVVGFRIEGPDRSVLFVPDIDSWDEWEAAGTRLEDVLATVDVAYVDATFYADGELGHRDMSAIPHPRIVGTMDRLAHLLAADRAKVRFIHLNHTNPALWRDTDARREIDDRGFRVAEEGERVGL